MSKRIVPNLPVSGNGQSDLICPVASCRAGCSFSSARFQVYCPSRRPAWVKTSKRGFQRQIK